MEARIGVEPITTRFAGAPPTVEVEVPGHEQRRPGVSDFSGASRSSVSAGPPPGQVSRRRFRVWTLPSTSRCGVPFAAVRVPERGLEPRTPRPTRGVLPSTPHGVAVSLEAVTRIELAPPAWGAGVLPLHHAAGGWTSAEGRRVELLTVLPATLQQSAWHATCRTFRGRGPAQRTRACLALSQRRTGSYPADLWVRGGCESRTRRRVTGHAFRERLACHVPNPPWRVWDSNPASQWPGLYRPRSVPCSRAPPGVSAIPVVDKHGFEPWTFALQKRCSAAELQARVHRLDGAW